MDKALNGDLRARVCADTRQIDWTASPSGSVWRKRVHRVGPAESGQVTSLVRYQPGATFPAHEHPDGEEILVIEGIFSDEHGDWPAGSYLLNPEGFRHAPFSTPGCLLFVKLRQYPGRERKHVAMDTNAVQWQDSGSPGVSAKILYQQPGFSDSMRLERWAEGAARGLVEYPRGAEVLVLEGAFSDEAGCYRSGAWLRLPPGAIHRPHSATGCTLYIKEGGFAYLLSADSV